MQVQLIFRSDVVEEIILDKDEVGFQFVKPTLQRSRPPNFLFEVRMLSIHQSGWMECLMQNRFGIWNKFQIETNSLKGQLLVKNTFKKRFAVIPSVGSTTIRTKD